MRESNIHKIRVIWTLNIGLVLFTLCGFFPRREVGGRAFILDSFIQVSGYSVSRIDVGRLLSELVVIAGLTGIFALRFYREHLRWNGENI